MTLRHLGIALVLVLPLLLFVVPREPTLDARVDALRREIAAHPTLPLARPVLHGVALDCDAGEELAGIEAALIAADFVIDQADLATLLVFRDDGPNAEDEALVRALARHATPFIDASAKCTRARVRVPFGTVTAVRAVLGVAMLDGRTVPGAIAALRTAGDMMTASEDLDSAIDAQIIVALAIDLLEEIDAAPAELAQLIASDPPVAPLVERTALGLAEQAVHELETEVSTADSLRLAFERLGRGHPRQAFDLANDTRVRRSQWHRGAEAAIAVAREAYGSRDALLQALDALNVSPHGFADVPDRLRWLVTLDGENDARLSAIARRAPSQ